MSVKHTETSASQSHVDPAALHAPVKTATPADLSRSPSNQSLAGPRGLPADLDHVHSIMLDGHWHTVRAGSLQQDGHEVSFGEPHEPEQLRVVVSAERISAYRVDSKKVEATKAAKLASLREVKAFGDTAPEQPAPDSPPGHEPIVPGYTEATKDEKTGRKGPNTPDSKPGDEEDTAKHSKHR